MSDILIYDIEVFKYDSLVVFKDITGREVAHFWSKPDGGFPADSPNGFERVPEVIRGRTIAGYNNYNYDDIILYDMIRDANQEHIKKTNDLIIAGADMSHERRLAELELDSLGVTSLDCMQQIDVSRPSLKKIEGNMGRSIVESDVSFEIDRPLTDAEKKTVLAYCRYDVDSTIEIYKLREKSYFEAKNALIDMFGDSRCSHWNTTTISANLLLQRPLPAWSKPRVPGELWRNVPGIPESVWEMWEGVSYETRDNMRGSCTVDRFGCSIVFGLGGLHGACKDLHSFGNVKLLDVSSMYPSIIVLLGALGDGTEKYKNMRDERLRIKHSNPVKSGALKLVLNSVYGLLKNKYSTLYNPMAAVTVCIYGQIALFDLCRRLHELGHRIININTDGVAFEDNGSDSYKTAWQEWEKEFGLSLELDDFSQWIQKDVNNYVARSGDHIKTKGGEVNKYKNNNYFSNNDARIIHMAVVDKLLFDKDPVDTIVENLNKPILFQYVLKAGNTYKGTFDKDGNKMQNVNRVFAAKEGAAVETTRLYKRRQDDGMVLFADAPENMLVYNGDLNELSNIGSFIDVGHYYSVIRKKLEGWGVYC